MNDERIPAKLEFLTDLLSETEALFGKKPTFLFLDELQNIPSWSKWLRRILDSENIKIFVTGSSSKMSSFEMPTELRGRALEIKLYPLTFSEFLRFKNKTLDFRKLDYLDSERAQFDFLFDEYLLYGGLPEVVFTPLEKKQELLQNYFQTVVRKEIVERFSVKNEEALKTLLKLLINSTYITISKLYYSLKSLGLTVGKTTLNSYLAYIKSSYFLAELYFYSPSMRSQPQYPRKIYFLDNGFLTSLSIKFSKNYGRLFENTVFWHLEKQKEEMFYAKDKQGSEVDFVIMKDGKVAALYQVCYDLSDIETREREIKSLIKSGKRLSCNDLRLVGMQGTKNIKNINKKIKLITHYEMFGEKW